jgi:tetratricopeptide (TPR) repeat protein
LTRYGATVPSKNARYINYCDLRCFVHWTQQSYPEAIEWGARGKELKEKSNVDTRYDAQHHLALAQRDSGLVDPALKYFLQGNALSEVIDPDEFDDTKDGSFYGNIGRCLHIMGQIEPALVCYRKSAMLLQNVGNTHVENQGFIRYWIGQLLIAKGDFCTAKHFLDAAKLKWILVAPVRISEVDDALSRTAGYLGQCPSLDDRNTERFCIAWIFGRERDFAKI